MPRPVLTITQVAKRLGISSRTIRVYEEEGFITLERVGGRCLIGQKDTEKVLLIKRLKDDLGVNLSGIGVILEMRKKMILMQERLDRLEEEFEQRLAEALEEQGRGRE